MILRPDANTSRPISPINPISPISSGYRRLALLLAGAMLCGCASMSDADLTRAQASASGAGLGALIGQLAGGNRDSTVQGAVLGALIGDIIGEKTVQEKELYAKNEMQLKNAILLAEQSTKATHQLNQNLASDILALQRQQQTLAEQQLSAANLKIENQALEEKLKGMIAVTHTWIIEVDQQLAMQNALLAQQRQTLSMEKNTVNPHLINVAQNRLSILDKERAVLQAGLDQLKSIDQRRVY